MRNEPKIELSALRQIGWDHWDPIGIRQFDADWPTEAPDEYDSYLLRVVSMLRGGQSEAEASAYLKIADSTQVTVVVAAGNRFYGLRRYISVVGNCM